MSDIASSLIENNPMVWFESCATIMDKHRRLIGACDGAEEPLRANFLQRLEAEILDWMEWNGYPGRLIKLKGRRQGSSTGTLANMAHRLRSRPTSALIVGLDYSKNVKVMEEVLWRFIDTDTYEWGVVPKRYIGKGGEFSNGSKLSLQSANTPNAGRGDGAQFALFTEAAYYPSTEQRDEATLFKNLLQLIPREPGTAIVKESTPNGEGGKFHETWLGAITFEDLKAGRIPQHWNGFVKLFQAWHEFPDYRLDVTPEQAEAIRNSLSDRERELIEQHPNIAADMGRLAWRRMVIAGIDFDGDEEAFESEDPSDEHSCFATSGAKYFATDSLKTMRDHARPGEHGVLEEYRSTVDFSPRAERESWVRVWERPRHGMKYHLTDDPMTGEQASGKDPDNHAIMVVRAGFMDVDGWHPDAVVARLADCNGEIMAKRKWTPVCRWDIDVTEKRLALLAKYYGNCPIVVEMNKDLGMVELLKKRGGMNIYRRREHNKKTGEVTDVYGWMTTSGNRDAILSPLQAAVRNYRNPAIRDNVHAAGLDIWDVRIIGEFEKMVRKPNGRVEAASTSHDDTVMGLAIALATKGCATTYYFHAIEPPDLDAEEGFRQRRRRSDW